MSVGNNVAEEKWFKSMEDVIVETIVLLNETSERGFLSHSKTGIAFHIFHLPFQVLTPICF